jgi:hypothetical protein
MLDFTLIVFLVVAAGAGISIAVSLLTLVIRRSPLMLVQADMADRMAPYERSTLLAKALKMTEGPSGLTL